MEAEPGVGSGCDFMEADAEAFLPTNQEAEANSEAFSCIRGWKRKKIVRNTQLPLPCYIIAILDVFLILEKKRATRLQTKLNLSKAS